MAVVSDSLTPNLGLKDIGEVCRPVVCASCCSQMCQPPALWLCVFVIVTL